MKNLILFLFLALLLSGCSKDIALQLDSANSAATTSRSTANTPTVYDAVLGQGFKEDNILVGRTAPISAAEIQFAQQVTTRDQALMTSRYPNIKQQMDAWRADNTDQRYSSTLQHGAIHYLRRHFLLQTGEAADLEIEYLLGLLVETQAIDLDVLVDAFLRVQTRLDAATQTTYSQYIRHKYEAEMAKIREKAPLYQDAYEQATNEADQRIALFQGKHLERISHSCAYTRQLMGYPN